METKVEKVPGNTFKVEVKIPKEDVNSVFTEVLNHLSHHVKVDGFREGKAPADLVKSKINKTTLRSEALNTLLGKVINDIVRDQRLKPITGPAIDIKKFDENEDAEFTVTIIERPDIKLNDYESAIKKIEHAVEEATDAKTEAEHDHDDHEGHDHKDHKHEPSIIEKNEQLNKKIIDKLIDICEVELSKDLIDMERNRMMSSLLDQVQKVGLTIDQYLTTIKKTADQLKDDYEKIAKNTLKADFLLHEIADKKEINVSDAEIQQMIDIVPDPKSKEALAKPEQRMYIKSVLTKTKILEHLRSLVSQEK